MDSLGHQGNNHTSTTTGAPPDQESTSVCVLGSFSLPQHLWGATEKLIFPSLPLSTIHQNAKVICSQQWQQFATAQRTSWWSSSSCSAAMGVWAGLASAQHREQKTSLNSSEVKTIFSPINDWLDTHHLLSCRWFTRTSHLLLQRKAHHSYLTEDNPD